MPLEYQRVKLTDLHEDPANARTHPESNLADIRASLKEFGQVEPLVVQKATGKIVGGNGRYKVMKELGWTECDVAYVEMDNMKATALGIALNRAGERAEWDPEVLEKLLAEIGDVSEELEQSFKELEEAAGIEEETGTADAEPQIDRAAELQKKWGTATGQLWLIGEHRLLCGDSASDADVEKLMKGNKINIAFTSPPYASQREYDPASGFKPIRPDDFVDWFKPIAESVKKRLQPDGSWFVNIKPACEGLERLLYVFDLVIAHRRLWGWKFAEEFCWERTGIPQQVVRRFKNQFEPVYQFVLGEWKIRPQSVMHESDSVPIARGKGAGNTNAAKRQGNCSAVEGNDVEPGMAYPGNRLPKFQSEAIGHSAAFPVGLPCFFIKAFSDEGDNVYEPFSGSGTTFVAAQNLHRKCYGIEISPAYCAVILERMSQAFPELEIRQAV